MKRLLNFLWVYRGFRVRNWYKNQRLIVTSFLILPILILSGFFIFFNLISIISFYKTALPVKIPLTLFLTIVVFLLVYCLEIALERKVIFFTRLRSLYFLRRKMFNSNFYTTKKSQQKAVKIKLEKAYLRQNKHSVQIAFELQGTKSEQRFLKIGSELETTFSGDLMDREQVNGFIVYTIAFQKYLGRISVLDVKPTSKGLQLMATVYWDFRKEPHMLISGGTGGGKSVLLFSIILALAKFANLYICDPKRSDLSNLEKYEVFNGQVYCETKEIVECIINAWHIMNKRYDYMRQDKSSKMGKDYADYGMKPLFVIVDEVSALVSELSGLRGGLINDYETALQQIAQKGRQAGVFLILALQKAGADAIPLAVRDQLNKRVTVGVLSEYGYTNAFGQEASKKEFVNITQINGEPVHGRGYIGNFGEIIEEFFAPFVPFDQGFDFFEEYIKLPKLVLDDYDVIDSSETEKNSDTASVDNILLMSEPMVDDEKSGYSRKELADFFGRSETTIQRITQELVKRETCFEKDDKGHYIYFDDDKDFFEKILKFKEENGLSYVKAVAEFID